MRCTSACTFHGEMAEWIYLLAMQRIEWTAQPFTPNLASGRTEGHVSKAW
jgi:hypothetical protein